jgi:hypothetical protein
MLPFILILCFLLHINPSANCQQSSFDIEPRGLQTNFTKDRSAIRMSTSVYTRILKGRSIRLLRLLPGEEGEPTSVSLCYASLDDPLPYEALSYV